MAHAVSLKMSADAASSRESQHAEIDAAVVAVKAKAIEFARLPVGDKRRLLVACMQGLSDHAAAWVADGCRAKGIDPAQPMAGEEWLGGPNITMRGFRLLAESLESIERTGSPPLGTGHRLRPDGRLEIDVFPVGGHDKVLFAGFSGKVLMQPGVDVAQARQRQAAFYKQRDPLGGLALVLGAGNVASIPPLDVVYKMFVDGEVCVLKMNPVNEWVGPHLERALAPLIERRYLAIVYGGADVGKLLVEHAAIDSIHITGSDRTHDLIVWGPAGPERERRLREGDPVFKKKITSELGNVSPVAIVPAEYSDDELLFQAKNVASMVTNNASFNCNAAKVLLVSAKWSQRQKFRELVGRCLASAPTRKAYYPGAADRYRDLTAGRTLQTFGEARDGVLPWTLIADVDTADPKERLFEVEPFCGILTEALLPEGDPAAFLAAATTFMNDRLWGTLNAAIIIHPRQERDPQIAAALDRAIVDLRYGTVAINHWPALGYGFASPPWGGHQSATLANIQSGLGWVHNTFMLDGIDKSVVRGPLKASPKPAWFFDNRSVHKIGPKLVAFELAPSWLKVPGLALLALRG